MAFKPERKVLLTSAEIALRIGTLAQEIARDFKQETTDSTTSPFEKCLMLLCVLESALPFAKALEEELNNLGVTTDIQYIKASSYGTGMQSNNQPTYTISQKIKTEIFGSDVLIVEDMIDTGTTLAGLVQVISELQPSSLHVAVLLEKIREAKDIGVKPYVGFRIPNLWVDGFGIDTNNENREREWIEAFLQDEAQAELWKQYRIVVQ